MLLPWPAQAVQILILHDDAPSFAAEFARGLRSEARIAPLELATENLAGADSYLDQLTALWRVKYAAVDLVIALDAASLDYLSAAPVFGSVPVIALSYPPLPAARPGLSFCRLAPDLRANLSLIRRLHPEVRRVKLVLSARQVTAAQRAAFAQILSQFAPQLASEIWPAGPELAKRLDGLGQATAVIYGAYACGFGDDLQNFRELMLDRRVPVYGLWDTYLGSGLLGGMLLGAQDQGRAVAAMLKAVLAGRLASVNPVRPQFLFDSRALEAQGLEVRDLPAGARLQTRGRTDSALVAHWLLLASLVGWLLTALWAGLLHWSRRRYRSDLGRLGVEFDFVKNEHDGQTAVIEELKAVLQESVQELVVVADAQGRIVMLSPAFARVWGAPVVADSLADLLDDEAWAAAQASLAAGQRWHGSLRLSSGQTCPASLRRISGGAPAYQVLVARLDAADEPGAAQA